MHSEFETIAFIQQGDSYLVAAQCLFAQKKEYSHPGYFIHPAVVLCHFGIELLLKACLSWENKKNTRGSEGHNLMDLAEKIEFINLNDENKYWLRQIHAAFYTRYPFIEDKDHQKSKEILDGIKEPVTNLQILPGEVGTDELNTTVRFYQVLVQLMP